MGPSAPPPNKTKLPWVPRIYLNQPTQPYAATERREVTGLRDVTEESTWIEEKSSRKKMKSEFVLFRIQRLSTNK